MSPQRRSSISHAPEDGPAGHSGERPTSAPVARRPTDSESDLSALLDAWETPTIPPPFDLEDFARDRMAETHELKAPPERPTQPAPEELESSTRLRARDPASASFPARKESQVLRMELADEFFEGRYEQALALAEELVARRPDDTSAFDYAEECRRLLEKEYLARIVGTLVDVPCLAISMRELSQRKLDHRAGFLLSRIDGGSSIEELIDLGALPRLETLRLVAELLEAGVLRLSGPGR